MSVYCLDHPSSNPRLPGKLLLIVAILTASLFPLTLVPGAEKAPMGATGQFNGKQGDVLWVEIPVEGHPQNVMGKFLQRQILFFPATNRTYAGLLGIDMQDTPGVHELKITLESQEGTQQLSYGILVVKNNYSLQRLTLPRKKVELDPKTLKRVLAEQKELKNVFQYSTPHPLWTGPFHQPVEGRITGVFGSRRIINGQPRNPHSGEDIAAPQGTDVAAMNAGVVRLIIHHFFTGNGVILDHGVGLYSMYFHLSKVSVQQGQLVKPGQVIGQVGSTGRASGPHLHWGVRLNNSRVNPYSLLTLPIKQTR